MKTYKIPNIDKLCVKKFQYVYSDSIIIEDIMFYHIYLGLYIGEDNKAKVQTGKLNGYGNLCIFEVMKFGHQRKRYSNLLFMYSKNYSTWDDRTLENYLKYHKECFQIPEQLKNEVNKISKWLTITDLRNSEFHSLDYEKRIAKFGFSNIELEQLFTTYEVAREEFSSSDDLNNVVYHPTKSDYFDITFQFPVTDDYIVYDGKIGTRICSDVYEFLDNLEYREEYDESYLDVCKPWHPRSVECGIYGLGNKLWGYFASFAKSFNGYSICYVTKNKNSEDFKHLKDKYDLVLLSPDEDNRKKEKEITEKCDRTEEDIINEYKSKGYVEVFEGAGFIGDWQVKFKKIFNFKSSSKKIEGKICMLSDSDILLFSDSLDKSVQLNKQLLRYLRVELNGVGHDFIEETDENEIALIGEELLKNMQEIEDYKGYY